MGIGTNSEQKVKHSEPWSESPLAPRLPGANLDLIKPVCIGAA